MAEVLFQLRTSERIDKVGARVISEIDGVMSLVDEALSNSEPYGPSLAGATTTLSAATPMGAAYVAHFGTIL